MEKIAVKFVNLDLFFDFASELYAGKAVVNSASKADCFFATSALLSLLLEQLGDRRYTTKVENASIGLVGGALDAIDELVAGTDCLFITGDPGGGKTFSAQEIALRSSSIGTKVVYFPCSRLSSANDILEDSIVSYLVAVSGKSVGECQAYLAQADLIVIDGIDEAMSLDNGLIDEILSLSDVGGKLLLKKDSVVDFSILPQELHDKLTTRRTKGRLEIEASVPLHWDEAVFLNALLSNAR